MVRKSVELAFHYFVLPQRQHGVARQVATKNSPWPQIVYGVGWALLVASLVQACRVGSSEQASLGSGPANFPPLSRFCNSMIF